jgi:tetratricopeptide (TPR) repeat protein
MANLLVKTLLLLTALLVSAPLTSPAAYPKRLLAVNPDSEEGRLLQFIESETDANVKLFLLEKFVSKFPKFESLDAIYANMQSLYLSSGDFEKTLAAGERVLAIDPLDIECAQRNLQAAEGARDAALIARWTGRLRQIALTLGASQQPIASDDEQTWKRRVEIARSLADPGSEEYTLYKKAFDAANPRDKIELLDELQRQYPQGQYNKEALLLQFLAYRQIGDTKKAFQVGERILETDQTREDVLLLVTETLYRQRADSKRVLAYSNAIIDLMSSKPKPAGVTDANWSRQKTTLTGVAYSMIGSIHLNQEQYGLADKALRQALPLLQSTGLEQQRAAALSSLGWANYKLKNYNDATNFYTLCMAINGLYREVAIKNISVIKSEQEEQH